MADKESFADLFEKEAAAPRARPLSVGDEVEGTVAHVGVDAVFVQLDEKRQGYFSTIDLPRAGEISVGQLIRGFVVDLEASGEIRLGLGFGKDAGSDQLIAAKEAGIPVEGKVVGVNKGGLDVEVGGVRAFCPTSQIEDRFVEDTSSYVGQTLRFLVTAIEGKNAVLSRRRVLTAEKQEAREALVSRLDVGALLTGRVTQVRDFGAFVDLGGIDGLLPRSELSHDRVSPEDVVTVGDVVDVKVLAIEERDGKTRITLSLKALSADPWDGIGAIAPVGKVVAGRVSRFADFGAFVRLAEGVEGLLHISELGVGVEHPDKVLEIGAQVLAVVKSVDRDRRRVALTLAEEGAEVGAAGVLSAPVVGSVVGAIVDRVERFGVFVQVDGVRGRIGRGLIPNAELGIDRGVDARKAFPAGAAVRAKVIETGEGRLRLSISAAVADVERAEFDGYRETHGAPKSMGTLADLLKKKLEQ